MRILFVLLTRYPSEKAYSVTTKNTILALQKIGHDVEILSPNDSSVFGEGLWGKFSFQLCSRALSFKSGAHLFNRGWFYIFLPVWLGVVKSHLKKRDYDLVWARNSIVPIFLGRKYLVFTEFHSLPNLFVQIVLRMMGSKSQVLGPISPYLFDKITGGILSNFKSVLAPMAAPENFFRRIELGNIGSIHKLCYIGRLSSLGIDQGVIHFIESFIEIAKVNEDISLLLIGVSEVELLTKLDSKLACFTRDRIQFIPDVRHEEIPNYVLDVDAFVLPYVEKIEFRGRFPIKAIEYAAMGRPIIASDIPSHREIFSNNCVWFYSPHTPDSLMYAIASIENDPSEAKKRTELARDFAKHFTYESRVQNILKALGRPSGAI